MYWILMDLLHLRTKLFLVNHVFATKNSRLKQSARILKNGQSLASFFRFMLSKKEKKDGFASQMSVKKS